MNVTEMQVMTHDAVMTHGAVHVAHVAVNPC